MTENSFNLAYIADAETLDGSVYLPPKLYGALCNVMGRYEDLIHHEHRLELNVGKYVVQVLKNPIRSSFVDKNNVPQPYWFVVPQSAVKFISKKGM